MINKPYAAAHESAEAIRKFAGTTDNLDPEENPVLKALLASYERNMETARKNEEAFEESVKLRFSR